MNISLLFSTYAFPYFLLGLIALLMLVRIRRQNQKEMSIWIPWLIVATVFWLFTQVLEYISLDLKHKIFWDNLQWLGISLVPAIFLLLTFDLSYWKKWPKPFSIIILGVVPAIIIGLVFTNEYHHYFVSSYSLVKINDFIGMKKEHTGGFWFFMVYSYVLLSAGFINLIQVNIQSPGYYRNQVRWVILFALVTAIAYLFDYSRLTPYPFIQFGPLVMAVCLLITAGSLSRLRVRDFQHVSQKIILDAISDPYLLLNTDFVVLDHNLPAGLLLGQSGGSFTGQLLINISPDLFSQILTLFDNVVADPSIVVTLPERYETYQARLTAVRDHQKKLFGYLLSFNPVVEATQLLQEIQRSLSLTEALSKVSVQVASSSNPAAVLKTMGDALNKLDIYFAYASIDNLEGTSTLEYVSIESKFIKTVNNLIGQNIIGLNQHHTLWPLQSIEALNNNYPMYVLDFLEVVTEIFSNLSGVFLKNFFKAGGIDQQTKGIFIPLSFSDGSSGVFTVWGKSLLEKDLPAFFVFGSQVSSAYEQVRLMDAEQRQHIELEHSNALMRALNQVALRTASTYDPNDVLETLGGELSKSDMYCSLFKVDKSFSVAEILYLSINSQIIRQLEKLAGVSAIGFRMQRKEWSSLAIRSIEEKEAVFIPRFIEEIVPPFRKFGEFAIRRGLKLVGIDENISGYFVPFESNNGEIIVLTIWGNSLQEKDLPAFSVFANQVANAFENARLYETERNQAKRLEHSNQLLYTLGQIVAGITSTNSVEEILDTMRVELSKVGLEFAYTTTDLDRQTAVLEYISIKNYFLDQIKKISGASLVGVQFPKALWPENGLHDFVDNRPQFRSDFVESIRPLFKKFGKSIFNQGLTLVGISEKTPGLFLPLNLAAGALGFLAIWGDSLRKEDVAAFEVFVRQVESRFENIRLFHQAEKEIAERRVAQKALLESREEYRGLFENAHDAILVFDPNTLQVLSVNDQACEIYGYSQEEFLEIKLGAISQDADLFTKTIEENLATGKHFKFETVQIRKDGAPMNLEINASPASFRGIKAIQSINRDVTSRKRYEEKLSHDAFYDKLTDLPNRALFLDRLTHVIARNSRDYTLSFAVLFLDLDRFKNVNDSLGHTTGDYLLIEVAGRLKNCLRSVDTVARLGGDEFVILLEDIETIHDVTESCSRILDQLSFPIILAGNEILISGSIGIVVSSFDYSNPEEYLRDADIAMYQAKDLGKARFEIFDESMRLAVVERLEMEASLRRAISNQDFKIFYQPIVNLNEKKIVGVEALIRWRKPDGKICAPAEFIPIAEETGMICEIGSWVLLEACSQLKIWNIQFDSHLTMSVNVSGIQLMMPDFVDEVKKVIRETGIDSENLSLEITESALIKDQKDTAKKLHSLKALSLKIHLDDFGTGYSSLSFLSQFPIDALKIDRQFVNGFNRDNHADLIGVITSLGNKLDLMVIAEGIETEAQLAFLKETGCKYGQGFYFSAAVDVTALDNLLRKKEKIYQGELQ